MPAPQRTPLARLHDTARQAGIIVVDAVDDDGPLLDDDTAAFVACGVCIVLNPGLDDGLRTDVLAMALALTYAMSSGKTDHEGDITSAAGFVLISRTREAGPVSALGLLATVIAHEHGCGTASAAFEYTTPVFELPRTGFERMNATGAGRNGLEPLCGVYGRRMWRCERSGSLGLPGPRPWRCGKRPIRSPARARSAFVSARLA
jgi:hypothetical protein